MAIESGPKPEEKTNEELEALCEADQADRDVDDWETIDWSIVAERDAARRDRLVQMIEQGLLKTADDFYHAALIFQHGLSTEDYQNAMRFSKRAWELGSELGKRLFPLTEDRYLLSVGKPQIWGTQVRKVDDKWVMIEPFDRSAKTDEERKEMRVLTEEEYLAFYNNKESGV